MASKETWSRLRHFKIGSGDNWGDPKLIDDRLLLRLDDFREWLGVPIHVLEGVKVGGHTKRSYHYRENGACAVDVIIPNYMGWPFDLVLDAMRFGFTGIGYYPDWAWGGAITGGLHLDTRPLKWDRDQSKNYKHSRWMGVKDEHGKQRYVALNFENMVKYAHNGEPWEGFNVVKG